MALQREPRIVALHAGAIVAHADECLATVLELDAHDLRARVEGVFHELLDDGRRPFDHLARRDLIGDGVGEQLNARAPPREHTHNPAISPPSTQPWIPSLRCTSRQGP